MDEIIILIFFGLLILILFVAYNVFIDRLKYKISIPCDKFIDLPPPTIGAFTSLSTFNKQNAYAFMVSDLQTTKFSACGGEEKVPVGFEITSVIKGFDKYAKEERIFAIVYYSSRLNMVLITFSGTVFFSEWFDDATFRQVSPIGLGSYQEGSGDLVHDGFYEIYKSLQERLKSVLINTVKFNTTVVFTGHSLGGALSTLAYYDLFPTYPNSTLYTFASPRVGNIAFSELLMKQPSYFRIFNTEDIIPQLPPPIIEKEYYQQSGMNVTFTQTLDTYPQIHTLSYLNFLEN
jgi:triacylglycerol lipase